MILKFLVTLCLLSAPVFAQPLASQMVCTAGSCMEGRVRTTIGTRLYASGLGTSFHLLPARYTSETGPDALHQALTSEFWRMTPSVGFETSSSNLKLPMNVALNAGLALYALSKYGGNSSFAGLPTDPSIDTRNASTPISAGSIALAANVWIAIGSGTTRAVVWDSIPDMDQLPIQAGPAGYVLFGIGSTVCSPPCSSAGLCSSTSECVCASGFTGNACESCASGFFGPKCTPCPAGCNGCDDGIAGTGKCSGSEGPKPPASDNPASRCNCLHGTCQADNSCNCNPGWTTADNGTACAKCATGFFLNAFGNCKVCARGCASCDSANKCLACRNGFKLNNGNACDFSPPSIGVEGTGGCGDGFYPSGGRCANCNGSCLSCTGPADSDCIFCTAGRYFLDGRCVGADAQGMCNGTNGAGLIADNAQRMCDTCGALCQSCIIKNFDGGSSVNALECTRCLPGYVINNGTCEAGCGKGWFLDPADNKTCTACDSACGYCSGTANFCTGCNGDQVLSGGKCMPQCPPNFFKNNTECVPCHPDCETCNGSDFDQCTKCPQWRPVQSGGRCLSTCSKTEFFDGQSTCVRCDSSCASCAGAGPNQCLACASTAQVLRAGKCVDANCNGSSTVVPGLGVCLSNLISNATASGTGDDPGDVTGDVPGDVPDDPGGDPGSATGDAENKPAPRRLAWWQIMLMGLGGAFIALMLLLCVRCRARRHRREVTANFASAKALKWDWVGKLRDRVFGPKVSNVTTPAPLGPRSRFSQQSLYSQASWTQPRPRLETGRGPPYVGPDLNDPMYYAARDQLPNRRTPIS